MLKKGLALLLSLIIMGGMTLTAFASTDTFMTDYASAQSAFNSLASTSSTIDSLNTLQNFVSNLHDTYSALKDLKWSREALTSGEISVLNAYDPAILPTCDGMLSLFDAFSATEPVFDTLFYSVRDIEYFNNEEVWADHKRVEELLATLNSNYAALFSRKNEFAIIFDALDLNFDEYLSDLAAATSIIINAVDRAKAVYDKIEAIGKTKNPTESQVADAYNALLALEDDPLLLAYITNDDILAAAISAITGQKAGQVKNPKTDLSTIALISVVFLAFAGSLTILTYRRRRIKAFVRISNDRR